MRFAAYWAILTVMTACSGEALAKEANPGQAKSEIVRLEKAWSEAFLRHDGQAISRILANDYVGIDGRGVVGNKATEIQEAKPRPKTPAAILDEKLSDIRVRTYGDAAVLTALNTVRFRVGSRESRIRYRRTTVWVWRDGRWQCVSFHASRVLAGG
jgi:ketosteroid isomerase-like protein